MEIKNKILKRELNKWINETPFSKKVFDLFATFIELADEISEIYQFKEQELSDYMAGWPSMYLFLILEKKGDPRKKYYEEKATKLIKPVLEKLSEHLKSESYQKLIISQQITGDTLLRVDGVEDKISVDAIFKHISRIGASPLTPIDIEKVEGDFVRYKRELYKDENKGEKSVFLTTKLNQVRMKAIHQYLYDKKLIDVDEVVGNWLYWFSLQSWQDTKRKPAKIKWIGAAYVLTNVVYILCENMTKETEQAMKNAFKLPKGSKFQKKTNIDYLKDPYKSIIEKFNFAERYLKDLH